MNLFKKYLAILDKVESDLIDKRIQGAGWVFIFIVFVPIVLAIILFLFLLELTKFWLLAVIAAAVVGYFIVYPVFRYLTGNPIFDMDDLHEHAIREDYRRSKNNA